MKKQTQFFIPEIPTIFTIFGATGDLMEHKIVPSLFFLYKQKRLPKHLKIFGFARREISNKDFRKKVFTILQEMNFVKQEKQAQKFLELFEYIKGDFADSKSFEKLGDKVKEIENEWKICVNKLYYLATPPNFIHDIVSNLKKTKLSDPCGGNFGWARIIVEKPIGYDKKSALELEKILSILKDEQIYRIDHYFGKEMVQGIFNFRFSNNFLEEDWNNKHIEKIEIKLLESVGAENRGNFYDKVGALRDVGQNHLLSVLALLTMDDPKDANAESVREMREKLLSQITIMNTEEIKQNTFRAQYEEYDKIVGVEKSSETETYFKLKLNIESLRWSDVPIFIESGKRVGPAKKEVVVTFKDRKPCIWCQPTGPAKNKVVFSFAPKQEINIEFWQRTPGFVDVLEKRNFNFLLYKRKSKFPYVEEYAKLFFDAIQGQQRWFLTKQEVFSQWEIVDPIVKAWRDREVSLHNYKPDDKEIINIADDFFLTNEKNFKKEIAIVGLGRMGGGLAQNLLEKGWKVVGYNKTSEVTKNLESVGLIGTVNVKEMVEKLTQPRIVWLMLPNGKPVDDTIFDKKTGLVNFLEKGDIIVDGGNSFFQDSIKREKALSKYGIHFLDAGVSGGPSGARKGACVMVGGDKKVFKYIEPLFKDMSLTNGYEFFSGSGAGHFVKMVHNGIEYGMMQAIGEGFNIMKKSSYKLDLQKVASVYNNGSVIESRLIGWLYDAFEIYGTGLNKISGKVDHTGEGAWTINTAKAMSLKAKVIEEALEFRKQSQESPDYAGQVVSALRGQFGQHSVEKIKTISK
ncbi:MAG: glucose-6-phosphate dehydrogenase [Candidatus Magasanikbacteria bacterium]